MMTKDCKTDEGNHGKSWNMHPIKNCLQYWLQDMFVGCIFWGISLSLTKPQTTNLWTFTTMKFMQQRLCPKTDARTNTSESKMWTCMNGNMLRVGSYVLPYSPWVASGYPFRLQGLSEVPTKHRVDPDVQSCRRHAVVCRSVAEC